MLSFWLQVAIWSNFLIAVSIKKVSCNPHSSYSVIQLALSDTLSHFHCLSLVLCFLNVQADQIEPEFWGASRNLGSGIKKRE